jgi:hypothetical protein
VTSFAVAEPRPAGWPTLALETSPDLLAFVSTLSGRLLMVAVCAALMRPMVPLWPAMALSAAAMSVLARRHAGVVTAAATILVFLLSPNWYQHDTLAAGLREAGPFDPRRGLIDWAAPALTVAVLFGFLAAVRTGRPRWIAAYPQVALMLGFFALLALAAAGVAGATAQTWLWSLTSAFSGYMWVVALIALEQRNRAMQTPFVEIIGAAHPFWGGPATPYTVAPGKLRRLAAPDDRALAICQIKAFKLLVWVYCLSVFAAVFDDAAHGTLRVPHLADALAAWPDGNVTWSTRWLALFVNFFDLILRLTIAGHVVIACARLAGYNLPRNTCRPLESSTIAEFWSRYYYYFKELMLHLFYFPTFFACFKSRPQLRAAFATFMAAGVGNLLFHFIREFGEVERLGLWRSIIGLETYAFYCAALSAGIAISQWRNGARRTCAPRLKDRAASFATVMVFFCLLNVFADTRRTVPLSTHLDFFVSLFEPWR